MRSVILLLLLAACTAKAPEPAAEPDLQAQQEGAPPGPAGLGPPPPPPPPAPSALPGLEPLGEAEVRAALGSGASCALSDGGEPLLVAVPERAVVKESGRTSILTADARTWAALREGGRFEGAGVSIEVDAGAVVARDGAAVARDSSVMITRGGRGLGTSHGPRWTCGS